MKGVIMNDTFTIHPSIIRFTYLAGQASDMASQLGEITPLAAGHARDLFAGCTGARVDYLADKFKEAMEAANAPYMFDEHALIDVYQAWCLSARRDDETLNIQHIVNLHNDVQALVSNQRDDLDIILSAKGGMVSKIHQLGIKSGRVKLHKAKTVNFASEAKLTDKHLAGEVNLVATAFAKGDLATVLEAEDTLLKQQEKIASAMRFIAAAKALNTSIPATPGAVLSNDMAEISA